MDCQDAREVVSAASSAGIGLTEAALAAAHLAECPGCARGEWHEVVDSGTPAARPFNVRVVSIIKARAWIGGRIRLLTPVRLRGSAAIATAAAHIIHAIRIRITPADAVLVRLGVRRRVLWRRGVSGGIEILRSASLAGTPLYSRLAHSVASLFRRQVGNGADTVRAGRMRVIAFLIRLGPFLQNRFHEARVGAARLPHRAMMGLLEASPRLSPGPWLSGLVAGHAIGIRSGNVATIANLVVRGRGLWTPTGRFADRARNALGRWAVDIRGISKMGDSDCSAHPSALGAPRRHFRVLQISSGIVAVLVAMAFFMSPPWWSPHRATSSFEAEPFHTDPPLARRPPDATATPEWAEISQSPLDSTLARPGPRAESRRSTMRKGQDDILTPAKPPAPRVAEEPSGLRSTLSDEARPPEKASPVENSGPSQVTPEAQDAHGPDPAAVIDWLLRRHRQ
jgi:hypothetical protein